MKIAFYKSTHSGIAGLYNRLVRWWDQGPYSHCEIIFSDGISASSSFMDKGVRFKNIEYNQTNWDFYDIPAAYEPAARAWFDTHAGQEYDLIGNIRFALGFLNTPSNKWFCSEAIAAAIGISDPWRISPNGLTAIARIIESKSTVEPLPVN
jgi:hypothetical protein